MTKSQRVDKAIKFLISQVSEPVQEVKSVRAYATYERDSKPYIMYDKHIAEIRSVQKNVPFIEVEIRPISTKTEGEEKIISYEEMWKEEQQQRLELELQYKKALWLLDHNGEEIGCLSENLEKERKLREDLFHDNGILESKLSAHRKALHLARITFWKIYSITTGQYEHDLEAPQTTDLGLIQKESKEMFEKLTNET